VKSYSLIRMCWSTVEDPFTVVFITYKVWFSMDHWVEVICC
jgi:hypothetical protein